MNMITIFSFGGFDLFNYFGLWIRSIFWRLACIRRSTRRWKSSEKLLQSTHGLFVCFLKLYIPFMISSSSFFLSLILVILWFEIGISWRHLLMRGSFWTWFWSWWMPKTPWKLVSTLATLSWPLPLPFPTMERCCTFNLFLLFFTAQD